MKRIKTLFSGKNQQRESVIKGEDEYYKELFIHNPRWNKAVPNREELLRWQIIEKFIYYIHGFRQGSNVQGKINILDLGCGRGWLSNLLSSYGEIFAVEPVAEVAAYAKKLFPQLNIEPGNADTLLARGMAGNFQLLVCSEVIEHVPDRGKKSFVSKIETLVSPGGFAIITTPRKEVQAEWIEYNNPDQPIEEWIDEGTLKSLFTDYGFSVVNHQRFAAKPTPQGPDIEIYQLWLFQKH
jgi:2-polyprenyl-3-methyl-5-hydroxy-6-metoxy-1,4-benzoquinol methylase